ncbi:TlpA family protein disulfide reductase [Rhizosphaericola mali]|uniref:TlpA family protein disulfide reductase n=1 Tax=Rhizosphaericola mali TaxID=2545455 RepID=A0A5P2FXF7_9BACT|nr:TlpA disulfide reductase family protein [Rhizosphaericola mali]QES87617.1 TlpA family protein disulfide reductase [Rhizosphaericola mali]
MIKKKLLLLIALLLSLNDQTEANNVVTISGVVCSDYDVDSVSVLAMKYGMEYLDQLVLQKGSSLIGNTFKIRLSSIEHTMPIVVRYYKRGQRTSTLVGYFIEPGDSIGFIDRRSDKAPYDIVFRGRGSAKLNIKTGITSAFNDLQMSLERDRPSLIVVRNRTDSVGILLRETLKGRRSQLSSDAYQCLLGMILAQTEGRKVNYVYFHSGLLSDTIELSNNVIKKELDSVLHFNNTLAGYFSFGYQNAFWQYKYERLKNNRKRDLQDIYTFFKYSYSGLLRERMVVQLLIDYKDSLTQGCIGDALSFMKDKELRAILKQAAKITPGHKAYNLAFEDIHGKHYRLSDFKDTVVLLDFWFNGCGACTQTVSYIKSIGERFSSDAMKILSVNIDEDIEKWRNGLRSKIYTTDYGINLHPKNIKEIGDIFNIYSCPTIIVIDKKGDIVSISEDPRSDNGRSLGLLLNNLVKK